MAAVSFEAALKPSSSTSEVSQATKSLLQDLQYYGKELCLCHHLQPWKAAFHCEARGQKVVQAVDRSGLPKLCRTSTLLVIVLRLDSVFNGLGDWSCQPKIMNSLPMYDVKTSKKETDAQENMKLTL